MNIYAINSQKTARKTIRKQTSDNHKRTSTRHNNFEEQKIFPISVSY